MKQLILILSLLLLGSCKYEDGPKLSLRSKKARAVNTWHLDKVYEDGVDKTDDYKKAFADYELDLKKDDNYRMYYNLYSTYGIEEKGTWEFSSDKLMIITKPENTTQRNENKIHRLKNKEFWVEFTVDKKKLLLHLK